MFYISNGYSKMFYLFISILFTLNGIKAEINSLPNTTIECKDLDDYYDLLYKICSKSLDCREIFYIDYTYNYIDTIVDNTSISQWETNQKIKLEDYRLRNDFEKFKYQLKLIYLFEMIFVDNITTNITTNDLFMKKILPLQWMPSFTIKINETQTFQCSNESIINITYPSSQEYREFIYIVLNSLNTYRILFGGQICSDYNEHLILDSITNQTYCVCKKDKSCSNESNFRTMMVMLMVGIMVLLLIIVFATYFDIYKTKNVIKIIKKN